MNTIHNIARGLNKQAAEAPQPGIWDRISGTYNSMPTWAQYALPAAGGGLLGMLLSRKNRLGGGLLGALLASLGTYGYRNWPKGAPAPAAGNTQAGVDAQNPYSASGGLDPADAVPKAPRLDANGNILGDFAPPGEVAATNAAAQAAARQGRVGASIAADPANQYNYGQDQRNKLRQGLTDAQNPYSAAGGLERFARPSQPLPPLGMGGVIPIGK